eukprot:8935072-Alexandrium_andersonii.AAC.1
MGAVSPGLVLLLLPAGPRPEVLASLERAVPDAAPAQAARVNIPELPRVVEADLDGEAGVLQE